MKKILIVTFVILISLLPTYAQNTSIPQGFYSYKLENGLEIFVQEDFTLPTVRIEYISKAGTGRQTEDTTGFYQLYSRLFWQNTVSHEDDYKKIGAGDFSNQVGFSQSRYSFIVPSSSFSASLLLFSNALKNAHFSDAAIKKEYDLLKQEVLSWSASVPGFINSSIDARVFSKEPWTKDSGVYPSLFASNTIEQVRKELSTITNAWYVPDQSALFISGPLSSSTILKVVQEYFGDWLSSYLIGTTSDASYSKTAVDVKDIEHNKHFVLVSNDFSKDYIQSVLQYTSSGLGATNKYSATAWTAAEIMQTNLIEAGMTNTNTSFVADASDSRIIIQTLFDASSVNDTTDLSLMVPGFANIVKSTAQIITYEDLAGAKNRALLYRNDAYTGADNFMEAVASNWAYGGVDYFFQWPQAVQEVELDEVKNSFNDPWIFVLLHPDVYAKNKENFDNFGYTEITRESGTWYSTFAANQTQNEVDQNIEPITPESSITSYTQYTKSLIDEFTLSSGIPVATQQIPSTPWISVFLTIEGGEILHGELKRGTEEIAVRNVKNTVEKQLSEIYLLGEISTVPVVDSETSLYSSYISIVCLEDDLSNVLQVLANTIRASTITIAAADELVLSSTYNWSLQSGSLEYQLYAAAMETLFGGSSAQGMFNANTDLLIQADYDDIKIATELLYDPNRISLVLTGNITSVTQIQVETAFGEKNFYPVEKQFKATLIEEQKPIFSPFEQIVRLRHTFLTDIPANLAGERPTKLIPTTDFSDPAQLYFEIPSFNDDDQALFNSLLYEVADRIITDFTNLRNPPAESVTVVPGTGMYPVSSLRFSKVKSRETLKRIVQNTFEEVLDNLESENIELTTEIKSRFSRILSREMLTLNDRSHLVWQGIRTSNNPALYLEKIETVEHADQDDFYSVFNEFLIEGEFFWLFSADTNR